MVMKMNLLCVTVLLILNYARGNGSSSSPIGEDVPEKYFPDIEYPQSVLESSRAFFKPMGVLEPFSEDVKSSFKSIVETNQKSKPESSNVENKNTNSENKTENVAVENINDADTVDCYYHDSNTGSENSTSEEYHSQKNLINETEKSSNETEAVSSDTDDTANIKHDSTESMMVQDPEPVEAVLSRPPSIDYEDSIAVVETDDDDAISEEKSVIEKSPEDD